jgi:hypothetical protein
VRSFFLNLTNTFFESKNLSIFVIEICLSLFFFTLRQVLSNFQRSIFFRERFNLSKLNITFGVGISFDFFYFVLTKVLGYCRNIRTKSTQRSFNTSSPFSLERR